MVYESDFYTTRRPYSSSSRPYVSSYTVTPLLRVPYYLYDPSVFRYYLRSLPYMPYTAHRKLVTIVRQVPVRIYHAGAYWPVVKTIRLHAKVRPSIIAAELNRIRYLTRPTYVSYVEKYLNSKGFTDFDDEAKDIRAKTDKLLRKIHVFVPRPTISDLEEHTLPERLRSDDYVRRIINAKNARKDIESLPWYSSPQKRSIGEGHLACIKYAGGRPQSKRRSYYTVGDLMPGDVKTDVKLMSYYLKNRKAAEDASPLLLHHHSVPISEDYDVGAPTTITWADEIVYEKDIVIDEELAPAKKKIPMKIDANNEIATMKNKEEEEEEVAVEQIKPEKKRKKEKKPKTEEESIKVEAVAAAVVETKIDAGEEENDGGGVQKTPDDDTIKRVQEYIEKKAAEKKMEEERRAWELEEARKHAEELEIARLAKIKEEQDIRIAEMKEQERLESERRAILDRAEELRKEAERLKEDEKLFNVAISQAIADEKERVAQEEEEFLKKQLEEEKEKLDLDSTTELINELAIAEEPHSEEQSLHADLSYQEVEAKPYEVDRDEDTQIEEDEPEEEPIELDNPFVDDEGAGTTVQADEPVEEVPTVRTTGGGAGDEGGFDWSDYDETRTEEAQVEVQGSNIEEKSADDNQQQERIHEDVASRNENELEEPQVEEVMAVAQADEANAEVEEAEATKAETQTVEEDVDIWAGVAEETSSSWRRMSTYRQDVVEEETRVEERATIEATVETKEEEEAQEETEEEAKEDYKMEEEEEGPTEEQEGGDVQNEEIHEEETLAEEEQVTEETVVEDVKSVHDSFDEEEEEENNDDGDDD